MLKRTPFYDFHARNGREARGFLRIGDAHRLSRDQTTSTSRLRKSGSIFDVSHMGRLQFTGKDATAFLNHIVTRNVD